MQDQREGGDLEPPFCDQQLAWEQWWDGIGGVGWGGLSLSGICAHKHSLALLQLHAHSTASLAIRQLLRNLQEQSPSVSPVSCHLSHVPCPSQRWPCVLTFTTECKCFWKQWHQFIN